MSYNLMAEAACKADQLARKFNREFFVVYGWDQDDPPAYHVTDEDELETYWGGLEPVYSTMDYVSP